MKAKMLVPPLLLLFVVSAVDSLMPWDRFFWPESARQRIEDMAAVLRRIEGPARWCYPSTHKSNLAHGSRAFDPKVDECIATIKPAGDFIEEDPGYYIKRLYRSEMGPYVCEVTLSTVFMEDRVVGSDCYYGLFRKDQDDGIGMTDDPFG